MFKFLHTESKTIIGAATIVGFFSFLSRIVGFVRDRILAGTFGAGDTLDIYYAAFKIPDFLFSLIVVGAVSASFIPLFTKHLGEKNTVEAWKFTSDVLRVIGCVMLVISALLLVFSGSLSALIAPGFDADKQASVAHFMRIMIFAQTFLAVSMVFGSALQSLKRFFLFALAPIFYNLGIVIGAVWLVDVVGISGLAWGVVLGAMMHMAVQWYGCIQAGYRYEWHWRLRSKDMRELMSLTGPRVIGLAVSQLLIVVMAMIATTLPAGSVTILQYAYNLQFFPVGIVGVSLAIASFPLFADALGHQDTQAFLDSFSSTIRQVFFFLIPTTVLFLILRAQMVRIVVGAGAYDWQATILTANTLAFFAFTIIPQSCVFILTRAFFALHDTLTPLTAGLIGALVGLISAYAFRDPFGVMGLAMAYSLYAIVNLILLWVPLRQRLGSLCEARLLQSFMKLLIAGLICAIVTQTVKPFLTSLFGLNTFWGVLLQGSFAAFIGLAAYLFTAHLLKATELKAFQEAMHQRFFKRLTPKESVPIQE